MTLLEAHLEQIALSSAAISELAFVQPKVFTNALLNSHDITALIRDTEPHESALFKMDVSRQSAAGAQDEKGLRKKFIEGKIGHTFEKGKGPTVATLLGGDLGRRVGHESAKAGPERNDVDIKVLLQGAERLCQIYPVAGASEKISTLRARFQQLNESIGRYEELIGRQSAQLAKMSRPIDRGDEDEQQDDLEHENADTSETGTMSARPIESVTQADMNRELDEIEELERKKKKLEERVSSMERDLGGLLR